MKASPIYGLVLAGGASKRMGTDKSRIVYRNKEERIRLWEILNKHLDYVYLSVKERDQNLKDILQIEDSLIDYGPIVALLSAFRAHPTVSWLILACDLPFISNETIELLIHQRDPNKQATCLKSIEKDYPEPLIAIWEKQSYPILEESYASGLKCPRRILQSLDAKVIEITDESILYNANTREEKDFAIHQLRTDHQ